MDKARGIKLTSSTAIQIKASSIHTTPIHTTPIHTHSNQDASTYTFKLTPTFATERSMGFDTICSLSIDGTGERMTSSLISSSSTSSERKPWPCELLVITHGAQKLKSLHTKDTDAF